MRKIVGSAVLLAATSLFLGGCTSRPVPAPVVARLRPAAAVCKDISGLAAVLAPGAGLLLGEMHGTVESPEFVANAACLALAAGLPVTVALEIPREETSRVDAFVSSAGGEKDRAALLAGPFWRAEFQDGRRSEAMFALLDRLRQMHESRLPIRVELLDRAETPKTSAARDRWLAESLGEAFDKTPGGVVIALMGNVHTRIRRGVPWDAEYEPAGFVLYQSKPQLRLTALDVSYQGGQAWICNTPEPSSCQVRPLSGRPDAPAQGIELFPEVANGHNGVYQVGELNASPPMILSLRAPTPPLN